MQTMRVTPENAPGHLAARDPSVPGGLRTSPSFPVRALLHLTTRRWRSGRRYLPAGQALQFEPFERAGWLIRVATPRNFAMWRRSGLLRDSAASVAVLPDRSAGLGTEAYTLLCMHELLRRIAKQALVLRGLPPRLSDSPAMLAHLRCEALARVRPGADPADAERLFVQIEAMLGECLLGTRPGPAPLLHPDTGPARPRDEYPPHLLGLFF